MTYFLSLEVSEIFPFILGIPKIYHKVSRFLNSILLFIHCFVVNKLLSVWRVMSFHSSGISTHHPIIFLSTSSLHIICFLFLELLYRWVYSLHIMTFNPHFKFLCPFTLSFRRIPCFALHVTNCLLAVIILEFTPPIEILKLIFRF